MLDTRGIMLDKSHCPEHNRNKSASLVYAS